MTGQDGTSAAELAEYLQRLESGIRERAGQRQEFCGVTPGHPPHGICGGYPSSDGGIRADPPVAECPDCGKTGRYDGRVLIGGRGLYRCSCGCQWQDADEKPSTKGTMPLGFVSEGTL